MATSQWSEKILSPADREAISEKVREVELKTTGEVIPMVVHSSIRPGHLPLVIGLSLFSLFLILDWHFWLREFHIPAVLIVPSVLLLCLGTGFLLTKSLLVQRMLTSNEDQWAEVRERAELEFYRGQFDHTYKKTGILIFVSYLEHKVVVLADQGINAKVPRETWEAVVNILTSHIKKSAWRDGFINAIDECGRHLQQHFPVTATGENANELKNELVVKE